MNNKEIKITKIFDADIDTVWRALTVPSYMKQWYFDIPGFKPEVGFVFEFSGGKPDGIQYKHICEITEVINEKKLSYSWRYEGYEGVSYVTFELFTEGRKTRLEFSHIGIPSFPQSVADFAIENFIAGWDEIINTSLTNFVNSIGPNHESSLLFDFKLDKSKQTVYIIKEFAADLSLVWDAFTTKELLDQWWAPKPFESKTKVMEFKVGGRRFYAMISPEGHEMWQLQQYTAITPKSNIKFLSVFADKDENPFLPGSHWDLEFSEQNDITTVHISIYNESVERMEKMIEMGFKEGFTMTLHELDKVILKFKK